MDWHTGIRHRGIALPGPEQRVPAAVKGIERLERRSATGKNVDALFLSWGHASSGCVGATVRVP
jgi:hypothetical protein